MKKLSVALLLFTAVIASPCVAQQQDPIALQRAITALQAQRNQAMDSSAFWEARASGLVEDLAKAQAKISELSKDKESTAQSSKKE